MSVPYVTNTLIVSRLYAPESHHDLSVLANAERLVPLLLRRHKYRWISPAAHLLQNSRFFKLKNLANPEQELLPESFRKLILKPEHLAHDFTREYCPPD
ncbi:hypothetical protein PSE10C_55930 [Pseudomonas amygdali pv. eriobotryae]|uniref:Uncharacterized protein n=1 Tax=Pseudomonas amygdali pv. eriobotryae TaxID=129137 RepID=A0A9P3AKJ6_PSEA0|nr:hypothetical protein PSE10A_56940 [Pseudomonas amygdali pv. eriobotryae]GFZ74851.1 hypothetical protein PSE10C_55930 [Pseudomonas amygdali pv. eriobotryae]